MSTATLPKDIQKAVYSDEAHANVSERFDACIECVEEARKKFLAQDGVVGVGYGLKERGGATMEDEPSIIVYVLEKKPRKKIDKDELIPAKFKGVVTDVVELGKRPHPRHNDQDRMWVDWEKIHSLNPSANVNLMPRADVDVDDVAILEIDDTYVSSGNIDWAKVTKRFLVDHPDVFDFVTYYIDTSTGLPGQGSFHSGIYNKTTGINYYAGSNLDRRSTFGSTKLQAFLSIGWIGNYVLLQEFGHMWGAYTRNRDTATSPRRYDLLISSSGQGIFHWGRFFDNDHSPMDYDGIDWQALGGNRYQSHGIADDYFHFCPLDLYLMGLTRSSQVGSFYAIQSPSANSGTITGTRKNMSVQNVIWAEGPRNPAYPNTQRQWKQAFIVLTKDARRSRTFANQVAAQRREFNWQAYKAMRYLGNVDTTLTRTSTFPRIRDISVSVDDNRVIVGWKTNVRTKGRVNYALSSGAFRRDQAHTEPFSTANDPVLRTSHGVRISGLTPNRTYYFEIIAETEAGLVERVGVRTFYTRKTNDSCAPDINNVSVRLSRIGGRSKVLVSWRTDEPADSLVRYGSSVPPTSAKFDPYPSTSHAFTLTGLSAGTHYISVQSRDAAGNVSRDDNNGNYYRVTVPPSAPTAFESVEDSEIAERTEAINLLVEKGDTADAIEQTSELVRHVGCSEAAHLAKEIPCGKGDLSGALQVLEALCERMDCSMEIVEQGDDSVEFRVEPDPLRCLNCVDLPGDVVSEQSGHPVLADIIASVDPALELEAHATRGDGHYRLTR